MSATIETNRRHYVGAARIMTIYTENMNLLDRHGAGFAAGYLLSMAEKVATTQAWDAYCRTRGRFPNARGIPGGVLSLASLEKVSPKFCKWLEEPYSTGTDATRKD